MNIREALDSEMNQIDYGWVDKDGNPHERLQGFSEGYALQTPAELRESKLGVCWDQVELEREILKNQEIAARTYFIVYYDDKKCPTHTFVLFERGDKTIWYEHAWEKHRGWHEFDSVDEALRNIREKFIELELKDTEINWNNLCIYEYSAPTKKLGCLDFYRHCEAGKNIIL